jgi:peroxiredoxin
MQSPVKELLKRMITNKGRNLAEISVKNPILLVFLRHFGCQFCRQGMEEISQKRSEFENNGVELIFVHMAEPCIAEDYFARFHLEGSEHISDTSCRLYMDFGLMKGTFGQLFGLQTWIRGYSLQTKYGNDFGKHLGDSFQMPGVFMIFEHEIKASFIHRSVADRPDYDKLVRCCAL